MIDRKVFALGLLMSIMCPGLGWAQMYSYVDDKGVTHYTNVPSDSRYKPLKMRSKGRIFASVSKKASPYIAGKGDSQIVRLSAISKKRVYGQSRPWRVASTSSFRYDDLIKQAASRYRVDPLLIKAIIKVESDFDRHAVSRQGARGLMQLMPETARDLRVRDSFDPKQNIYGGTRYFKNLLTSYRGNLSLSLAAYNAGPTLVNRLGRIPRITETRNYVKRVLQVYQEYQRRDAVAMTTSTINVSELITIN